MRRRQSLGRRYRHYSSASRLNSPQNDDYLGTSVLEPDRGPGLTVVSGLAFRQTCSFLTSTRARLKLSVERRRRRARHARARLADLRQTMRNRRKSSWPRSGWTSDGELDLTGQLSNLSTRLRELLAVA